VDEIAKVKQALVEPLKQAGYELADVSLRRDKDGLTLAIVVDHEAPISLDDIVKVSDLINPLLDQADPIAGPYTLDVSSLGAEKELALDKLERYLDRYVALHLTHPYQGMNTLEGYLRQADGKTVALEIRQKAVKKTITLPRADIDKARLAIKF
jgi:ribosome maturation factor RimP